MQRAPWLSGRGSASGTIFVGDVQVEMEGRRSARIAARLGWPREEHFKHPVALGALLSLRLLHAVFMGPVALIIMGLEALMHLAGAYWRAVRRAWGVAPKTQQLPVSPESTGKSLAPAEKYRDDEAGLEQFRR